MFTLEVKTPRGWVEPEAVRKSEMTEHEAIMMAAEIFGAEYWSGLIGGEEKVRVVKRAAALAA